jgi:hypothetical protein
MKSNDDLTTNPATAQYNYSIVLGDNATDAGAAGGIVIGRNASAGGNIRTGVAIGYNTQANGNGTYVGWNGTANGDGAQAFGLQNTASQESSLALGVLASAAGRWGMAIGRSVSSTGQKQVAIGHANTITNGSALGGNGEGNAVLAGYTNSISSTGQVNTIVGGSDNVLSGTTSGTTLIGLENFTSPTNDNTTYVDKLYSVGSRIDATDDSVVVNSTGTSAIPSGKPRNAVISSIDGVISSSSNDGTNTILGTYQGTISAGGVGSIIAGGGSQISSSASLYNTIVGGQINGISAGARNSIFGGYYADITSGSANVIVGGNNSQLTGGSNSAMLGGSNNTSTHSQSVMLGGDSQTSVYDNTAHVEHIHTFKTETFDTVSGGTIGGSVDIDVSEGTIYKFSISANTTPNITGWREGQRLVFVVVNLGTHTVPTMTITGGGSVLAKGGALNPTNNGTTKYTGVIIDGDLYLNEELDFQAV